MIKEEQPLIVEDVKPIDIKSLNLKDVQVLFNNGQVTLSFLEMSRTSVEYFVF